VIDRKKPKRQIDKRLRKKLSKPSRRVSLKSVVGVLVSIIAFAAVLAAFDLGLGWPNSLLTLGVMLAVAWFVGAAAGGRLLPSRPSVTIPLVLAVVLAGSTLGFGVPWGLQREETTSGENVLFMYEASFAYRGSADNIPIENVEIGFPCPNIENEPIPTSSSWTLYWQDIDNTLHPEISYNKVTGVTTNYEFYGNRTENLEILLNEVGLTSHGPKLHLIIDKLYPREVFWTTVIAVAPKETANRVTLVEVGENQRTDAYYEHWPLKVEFINLSFWAQLSKVVDENTLELIETFSRVYDNGHPGWYWLYP
jgi:hypothetical protein